MAQLTVLTMNCLGLPVPLPGLRRRLLALGKALADTDADVACLQEIGRWRYLPLVRHDETRWSHAAATLHPYAPKGGLVTLTRMPVTEQAYYVFRDRGSAASLHATERYQSKGVLQTTIGVGKCQVVVLNTHLAANYQANWGYTNPYAKVERAQLRQLAEVVQSLPEDLLVVVAGDFNVPRHSWLYEELCAATGLIDPLVEAIEPTYRPMPGVPARAAQALDHVLVRAPQTFSLTLEAELCFRDPVLLAHGTTGYLSDHLGVRLVLRWDNYDR
jgi:endonuclease/exonuclease/phosphatase family metal-dependent hydrolase